MCRSAGAREAASGVRTVWLCHFTLLYRIRRLRMCPQSSGSWHVRTRPLSSCEMIQDVFPRDGAVPQQASNGLLSERVYGDLMRLIAGAQMPEGARLPPERDLAERFGVSRPVVREVLSRLASDGIVVSRRGAGSFVRRPPTSHLLASVPTDALRSTLGTFEIRIAVEPEAAKLSAARRTDAEAATLVRLADELATALAAGQPSHDIDLELHRTIAISTRNPMFETIFEQIGASVAEIMVAGEGVTAAAPSLSIRMADEHLAIVDAIGARDGDAAASAMRNHLFEGRKRLFR